MGTLGQVVIGGILPAILWGVTAIIQKLSAQQGAPPGHYLAAFGAVICASGLLYSSLTRGATIQGPGIALAALAGVTFSFGTGLISFALWKFGTPISRLAPVLSGNVLVTVLIGMTFLHETLPPLRLIGGTVLIVGGVILVSLA